MASTIRMVGRAVQPEEALNGIKRARLSLRFNTRRLRHWILVQLVSVPVQTGDEQETASSARPVQRRSSQTTLERLVDDYRAAQFARRWA